ncbi:hypothetical protein ACRALDRAFT_2021715 [Sodiomyces alcalophilus JCM 7366]|uniref:uncharacterized protein n=1 Tax=Sodiomyces alcalophilus JCM 7366 TaxID=591952 RepID=UPI0039B65B8A
MRTAENKRHGRQHDDVVDIDDGSIAPPANNSISSSPSQCRETQSTALERLKSCKFKCRLHDLHQVNGAGWYSVGARRLWLEKYIKSLG